MSTPYTATINGQSVFVEAGTLHGDSAIAQRSTAAMTVHTNDSTFFAHLQQVAIYDQNGALTFSGYLNTPKRDRPGRQASFNYTLTCFDQHWLADKRIIGAVYSNMTPAQIANAIYTTYLQPEGVTIGLISDPNAPPVASTSTFASTSLFVGQASATIPSAVFAYSKVSQALDKLVEVASSAGIPYYWQIDQNLKFWFVPYTAVVNSTVLDNTIVDNGRASGTKPSVQDGNPLYRNVQYGTGGVQQTSPQAKGGVGDGKSSNFTMDYSLYQLKAAYVNGVSQSFGVKGVDTGKMFYYAVGDPVIVQDPHATKLTSGDTWEFDYIGQFPNVTQVQNQAQIAYMQALQPGTTGLVEEISNDTSIASAQDGFTKESALLTRYGVQGQLFVGMTRTAGFAPGQLVTVNLPELGVSNSQMLIEQVSFSDQHDGFNIWYQITAVSGPYDSTWPQFFQKLLTNAAPLSSVSVGVSQSVNLLQQFSASLAPSATLTPTVYACPIVGTGTLCNTTLKVC